MDRSLVGMAVLVTGASSGIGRAVAARAAAEGARVLAVGRRAEALNALVTESPTIVPYVADLTVSGAPDEVVAAAIAQIGGLDGLVHAAGTVRRNEDLRETTDLELAQHLNENLVVSMQLARAAYRAMAERGSGSIVLFGSQLAQIGSPGYATYSAAKGGITAFARALAVDAGPRGIRVNVLAPGVVQTPMAYVGRDNFDSLLADVSARHPLRRIGQPEDLAGPAVFLLGQDSAWMTGHTLVVDGGFTIQ